MREQFCTYCSYPFLNNEGWPRVCSHCHELTWKNPEPVGIGLIPVRNENKIGLLLVKRAIPPIGGLALPGGFMEYHESWQDSISRELLEETGAVIPPQDFTFFDIRSSTHNGKLLVFGLAPEQDISIVDRFHPNSEVSEVLVAYEPCDLCFPLQTEVLMKWFDER